MGARISPVLDASVTHVLMDDSEVGYARVGKVRQVLRHMREAYSAPEKHLVTGRWVDECVAANEHVPVDRAHHEPAKK